MELKEKEDSNQLINILLIVNSVFLLIVPFVFGNAYYVIDFMFIDFTFISFDQIIWIIAMIFIPIIITIANFIFYIFRKKINVSKPPINFPLGLIGTILILVPPIWHYGLGFFPLLFYDYGISIMVALYVVLMILGYTELKQQVESDFVTLIHAENSDKDENI